MEVSLIKVNVSYKMITSFCLSELFLCLKLEDLETNENLKVKTIKCLQSDLKEKIDSLLVLVPLSIPFQLHMNNLGTCIFTFPAMTKDAFIKEFPRCHGL